MTLSDVIDTLQTWIRNADDEYDREEMGRVAGLKEALHEIKRIEPCEDAISRQELKKMFREKCVADCSCCKYWRGDDWCEIINELPSVTPQPKTGHWIPIVSRPMTDEEKEYYKDSFGCEFEDIDYIYDCPLPDDGQTVLITDRLGNVEVDTVCRDDGCYFEYNCDAEDVLAWMPLPEPYRAESEDKE